MPPTEPRPTQTGWADPNVGALHWEQPSFASAPDQPLSGEVVATQPFQTAQAGRAGSAEERTWRLLRSWIWPIWVVVAIVTGNWSSFVVVIVVSILVSRRLAQLRSQRTTPDLR